MTCANFFHRSLGLLTIFFVLCHHMGHGPVANDLPGILVGFVCPDNLHNWLITFDVLHVLVSAVDFPTFILVSCSLR